MPTAEQEPSFKSLFMLSLGLLLLSVTLTYGHTYAWSWPGHVGVWAVPLGCVIAVFIFYFFIPLMSHRWLRLNGFYTLVEQLHRLTYTLTWWQIIVLSMLAGVGEELLFRGFLQSWLGNTAGPYWGVFICSVIFGLLHAMTRYYFIFALLMSLILGVLFEASQSMWLVVVVHTVYDVVALAVIAKYPHYLGVVNQGAAADELGA